MSRHLLRLALALALAAFLTWGLRAQSPSKNAAGDSLTLALVGAKIYPSPTAAPIADGVVLVRDGKIVAVGEREKTKIPAAASVLDCSGKVLTAGFQNSHVHFSEPKWENAVAVPAPVLKAQLQNMLTHYGFTTVVDTGSFLANTVALRARIESGEVAGPRIYTAGTPLYPENGVPYYVRDALPPALLPLLATPKKPEDAVALVQQHFVGGADIIKLFTGSWITREKVLLMALPIAKAAVAEAHRQGKLVFTHPSNIAGLEIALESGVDILAHAIEDTRGWNDASVERMKSGRMAMIPTLKLFAADDNMEDILREVSSFSRAGGQILFGTDVGYLTDYDPARDYALLARANLSWQEILASLTTAPAERFGEASLRGRIAAGMDADLVVLEADPARDVTAFARVRFALRAGRIIYRAVPR